MKPVDFAYVAPDSVSAALAILREHGDTAKVLAGGQSLVPLLNMRLARPQLIVDISRITGLDGIIDEGPAIRIGALTRHRAVEQSAVVAERLPLVADAVRHIGHVQIRNRGTVGGSMSHADPAAEWPLLAATLDAEFAITGREGSRTVPAAQFFTSLLSTAVAADELLLGVRFPVWTGACGWSFQEVARRHGDFALVAAAVQLQVDRCGHVTRSAIAMGGVGSGPVRAGSAEAYLADRPLDEDVIAVAARTAISGLDPDSDLHASAEYRRAVAEVLVRRGLAEARERARAKS